MTIKTTMTMTMTTTMMMILTPPPVAVPRRLLATLLSLVLLVLVALPPSLALAQRPPTPATSTSTSTVFTPIQQYGDQSYYVSPDPAYVPRDKVSGQAASLTLTRYLDNVAKDNEEVCATEECLTVPCVCMAARTRMIYTPTSPPTYIVAVNHDFILS